MRRAIVVLLSTMVLALWGCCDKPVRHEKPPPPVAVGECTPPALAEGQVWNGSAIPAGNAVCLEKFGPASVVVGQEFEYLVKVRNISRMALDEVIVTDRTPTAFKLLASDPQGTPGEGGELRFNLGRLMPGEERAIRVRGSATATGELMNCTSVDFKQLVCIVTKVVQPALKLTKAMPPELIHCDPIPIHLVVTNPGNGPAMNVRVADNLPAGWTMDGGRAPAFDLGVLNPGESKVLDYVAHSSAPGQFTNHAIATAEGGLKAEAEATITLRKPVLRISKTGRETQYIHRPVTYEIVVENTGDGPARDATLEDVLEGNMAIRPGAGMEASANHALWHLGTLAPGEQRKLTLEIMSDVEGMITDTATARAYCAADVTARCQTRYEGIPALLLEVVDLDDPVEIGQGTTYVITVTNQGSQVDTNIRLTVDLEAQAQFVSAEGATPGTHQNGKITFAPLAGLPPKAQAQWRLIVKATAPGDTRFKASLESDQLTRPVQETESTNMYR